ncbi:methyl-accepting chemotaxis protein [Terasakiella pusilla]|uniref:methyl-accepting chemotaxis protein n=1 Tax=Terasakiella pusilla TaxID=64973 RepID=UPI003AA99910
MYWTIRKIMALIGVFSTAVMIATLIWLSSAYEKFSIRNFNETSGEIASFLVRQTITEQYFEELFPIADKWSRDRVLVQGARENDVKKVIIGADAIFVSQEVVNKIVFLEGVQVFDKDLNVLAHSDKGISQSVLANDKIVRDLKARDKQAQRKPIAFTWSDESGKPLHSLVMPIGGFKVAGYIEFITNPINHFQNLGSALSGEVKLSDQNGTVILESHPQQAQGEEAVDAAAQVLETLSVDIPAATGQKWLTVSLTRDISAFKQNLQGIRDQAIMIIALALVLCAGGGWLLLRFAVFAKLRNFANAMQVLGEGNTGITVPPTGKDEFRTMAESLEMLRESVRQAYRRQRIIDNNTASIMICDLDGKLDYCNAAGLAFLGMSAEEVKGKSVDVFDQGEAFVQKLLTPEELPFSQQITFGYRHVALEAQSVLSLHGNHVNTMLSWTDITQQTQEREFSARIMEEVTSVAQVVTQQAQSLEELSRSLDGQSHKTVTQAHDAKNISVRNSESAQQAAETTERLTLNFADMADQTKKAQETAETAITVAKTGDQAVEELEKSSSKIGEVTRMISDIAAQTRMLALNATIEAQRAGEAGKGFAVVADEVGRLAGLTSNATEEISHTIQDVQNQVVDAKTAIGQINDVIGHIHHIQNEVSSSMAQQEGLTSDISNSVVGISQGSQDIDEIVQGVGSEAERTGDLANSLRETSAQLSKEASGLQSNIDKYLKHIEAAS